MTEQNLIKTAFVDTYATDIESPSLIDAMKKHNVKLEVLRYAKGGSQHDQEDHVRLTATTTDGTHPFEPLRDLLHDQWCMEYKQILEVWNDTQIECETGAELLPW